MLDLLVLKASMVQRDRKDLLVLLVAPVYQVQRVPQDLQDPLDHLGTPHILSSTAARMSLLT